jgi:signal peptide peptidase SppA
MNVLLLDPSALDHYCGLLHKKAAMIGVEIEVQTPRVQTLEDVAVLPIHGVLDYRPSFLSDMGMMCSTMQARAEFRRLVAEPSVSKIVLDIDSPGGLYSGVPEFAKDIYDARDKKSIIAVANPMAASGALWLGAAASKLFVLGSGEAGSLGALMVHQDASEMHAGMGIKHQILRSPKAKADFNSLEPLTEESRAHHQGQIEQIAEEFLKSVAKFRGVDPRRAAKEFGEGRMLMAKQAVDAGLADGMVSSLVDVVGRRMQARTRPRLHPQLEEARARREAAALEV